MALTAAHWANKSPGLAPGKDGPQVTQEATLVFMRVLSLAPVTPGSDSRVLSMRSKDPVVHHWSPGHSRITPGFASILELRTSHFFKSRTRDPSVV